METESNAYSYAGLIDPIKGRAGKHRLDLFELFSHFYKPVTNISLRYRRIAYSQCVRINKLRIFRELRGKMWKLEKG